MERIFCFFNDVRKEICSIWNWGKEKKEAKNLYVEFVLGIS